MLKDDELAGQIRMALMQDRRLSAQPIEVSVAHGRVTLDGTVQSYRRKLAAQEIARSLPGCRAVENHLVVEPIPTLPDDEVASLVRSALDASADVTKEAVTVSVNAGAVTLAGSVSSRWERLLAQDVALSIRGVRSVQNLLVVDLPGQVESGTLAREIRAAIKEIPELEDADVQVAVSGDTVVLSGEVCTLAQKEMAQATLRQFRPIRVRNEIRVEQG